MENSGFQRDDCLHHSEFLQEIISSMEATNFATENSSALCENIVLADGVVPAVSSDISVTDKSSKSFVALENLLRPFSLPSITASPSPKDSNADCVTPASLMLCHTRASPETVCVTKSGQNHMTLKEAAQKLLHQQEILSNKITGSKVAPQAPVLPSSFLAKPFSGKALLDSPGLSSTNFCNSEIFASELVADDRLNATNESTPLTSANADDEDEKILSSSYKWVSPLTIDLNLSKISSPLQTPSASSPSHSPISFRYNKVDTRKLEKSGYLLKQSGSWKNWKRKYFVLQNANLFFFKSKEEASKPSALPLDVIPLTSFFNLAKGQLVEEAFPSTALEKLISSLRLKKYDLSYVFKIETVQRTWILCAETEDDLMDWLRVLQDIHRNISSIQKQPQNDLLSEGWLEKHTKGVIKRRWCVLTRSQLDLFKAPGDEEPCNQFALDSVNHCLEIISPTDNDSDLEEGLVHKIIPPVFKTRENALPPSPSANENGKRNFKANFRFAIHMNRGASCHWFRCESEGDLENWVHGLLCIIPIAPACRSVFETLISGVIYGIVEHCNDIDLEDPQSIAYIDAVREENGILCYEKDISKQGLPLTSLPTNRLVTEAFNIAKAVHLFSNSPIDHEGIEYHFSLVQALLQSCLNNPSLQNELLLQLTKQTTLHPDPQSASSIQLWQLFAISLGVFSPIRDAYHYIKLHLIKVINRCEGEVIGEYAFYCLRMLLHATEGEPISFNHSPSDNELIMMVVQNRKFPPSYMEMMHILGAPEPPKPMRILVDCKNEEILSLPFEPFSKVSDIISTLKTALGVGSPGSSLPSDEFKLYLRYPPNTLNLGMDKLEILGEDMFIADVIYKIDAILRARSKTNSEGWWWLNDIQTPFLVFKIRFFLPSASSLTLDPAVLVHQLSDVEKKFLISYTIQLLSSSNLQPSELTTMSSLYAQQKWGDHNPLVQERSFIYAQINDILRLFHKSHRAGSSSSRRDRPSSSSLSSKRREFQSLNQADAVVAEISRKWTNLRGMSASECMNLFLILVMDIIGNYEFKVFVECFGKDLGDLCRIHLSREGLRITCRGRYVVQGEYSAIVYYVCACEKSVIIGIRSKAVDERMSGRKTTQSEVLRLTVLLADENITSADFVHIFGYFAGKAATLQQHQTTNSITSANTSKSTDISQ